MAALSDQAGSFFLLKNSHTSFYGWPCTPRFSPSPSLRLSIAVPTASSPWKTQKDHLRCSRSTALLKTVECVYYS